MLYDWDVYSSYREKKNLKDPTLTKVFKKVNCFSHSLLASTLLLNQISTPAVTRKHALLVGWKQEGWGKEWWHTVILLGKWDDKQMLGIKFLIRTIWL